MLGCDGSWPGPGGAGSGYLVEAGGTALLLDAGPGTFARLQEWGDPAAIDAVILSHEHPDHWTDLESFITWAGYGPGRAHCRDGGHPLAVFAPPGLAGWSHAADAPWVDWHELAPSMVLTFGAIEARFVAADHGPPTLAVGLAHDGATLAYSADTVGQRWVRISRPTPAARAMAPAWRPLRWARLPSDSWVKVASHRKVPIAGPSSATDQPGPVSAE